MVSSTEPSTTRSRSTRGQVLKYPGTRSRIGLWLGPAVFLSILFFVDLDPSNPLVTRMAAVVVLMAIWWITEAIPLPATALLPIVLFPFLGIMRGRVVDASSRIDADAVTGVDIAELQIMYNNVASQYVDWLILLFLGGFIIAIAVEKWNLHKRIALHILSVIGGQPHRLSIGLYGGHWVSLYVVIKYSDGYDDDAHGFVIDSAVRKSE